MNNKKIKICNNWINNSCSFMKEKEKCNFAHGDKDIIKVDCWNYTNCFDEDCKFNHNLDWIPEDNKMDCLICLDSKIICNKENKKYKHNKKEVIKKDIYKIPEDNDFPEFVKPKENYNINIDKNKYTYSEILTSKIKNDLNIETKNDINKEIKEIKNKLKKKYIYLKAFAPNEWANYDEIDKIEEEIRKLKDKYNEIRNKGKKNDILDNNLDLDIIFIENNENDNLILLPNIKLTINGISCDDMENLIIKTNNKKQKNNNIEILIENMEKDFNKYNEIIKEYIINIDKDDYLKYILINDLNRINSKIITLKNNYKDIINL